MTTLLSRLRLLMLPMLGLALVLAMPGSAAAVGAALHVDGSTDTTVVQGGTIELTWATTDADTATAWTHQGGTPVAFPAWDGTKAVGPANNQTVTVDLPPGSYFLVIEASSGGAPAISSVSLTVLPGQPGDDSDDDDGATDVDDDGPAAGDDTNDVPTVAPRAGVR